MTETGKKFLASVRKERHYCIVDYIDNYDNYYILDFLHRHSSTIQEQFFNKMFEACGIPMSEPKMEALKRMVINQYADIVYIHMNHAGMIGIRNRGRFTKAILDCIQKVLDEEGETIKKELEEEKI